MLSIRKSGNIHPIKKKLAANEETKTKTKSCSEDNEREDMRRKKRYLS
jgi:hypothetical protein